MAGEPEEPFQRIDVEQAEQLIKSGKVRVIDVRETDEYQSGHLPGAQHIPLNRILTKPTETISGSDILFVCAVGQRSAVAAEMAAAIGVENIYNLEGGTQAWIAAGKPVER
jgi:rhodanese-related sulfurtransferase